MVIKLKRTSKRSDIGGRQENILVDDVLIGRLNTERLPLKFGFRVTFFPQDGSSPLIVKRSKTRRGIISAKRQVINQAKKFHTDQQSERATMIPKQDLRKVKTNRLRQRDFDRA